MMLVAKAGAFQVKIHQLFNNLTKFSQFWVPILHFSDIPGNKSLHSAPSNRILIALFIPCAGMLALWPRLSA
jgi:hypothetical protein